MQIKLKNNQELNLEMNSKVFQYLNEYEDGVNRLKKDLTPDKNLWNAYNHIIYSVVKANVDDNEDVQKLISLIKFEDILKILDFCNEQSDLIVSAIEFAEQNINTQNLLR